MARAARADEFDPSTIGVYHCTNRCVRQAFLCGDDPLTGVNYEHRRGWIEKRLEFLAGFFAIDVAGYAILSNHFHVILRNRPDVVETWSDGEVARRWLMLCPIRKNKDGTPEVPKDSEIGSIINDEGGYKRSEHD